MIDARDALRELPAKWRETANGWRGAGFDSRAEDCEHHADELESALAASAPHEAQQAPLGWVRRKAIERLRNDLDVPGVMVHDEEQTNSVPVYLAPQEAQQAGGEPTGYLIEWRSETERGETFQRKANVTKIVDRLRNFGCEVTITPLGNPYTSAQQAGGEAVRYVRWHPKHGYDWRSTMTQPVPEHIGWISIPLYTTPPTPDTAALVALAKEIEVTPGHVATLHLRRRWADRLRTLTKPTKESSDA